MKGLISSGLFGIPLVILLLISACGAPLPTTTPTAGPVEWDYVAIGESITFEATALYAQMLEQDLGVSINFLDYQSPGLSSTDLLEDLRNNAQLRSDLQQAEVITFLIPLGVISNSMRIYELGEPGACGGEDNQDCIREAFAIYMADTDAIIAEITSLRSPSEALLRMQDVWLLKVGEVVSSGSFELFYGYWQEITTHVHEVAASYNIPVAHVYDAFMGEDGAEDPRDHGLIISDGLHPSTQGAMLVAELFRELGYDYAPPSP